eukprot:TRINITY_DN83659_c0_g1_i1.p1 TRINITY_DN83659_c0_g1~~TRINITY_DN83659_c0_g1_i1.p1  ORF type:complete len:191 (-),score=37.09 TRINITY_DN83659_c0_g1_i1:48-620(-)
MGCCCSSDTTQGRTIGGPSASGSQAPAKSGPHDLDAEREIRAAAAERRAAESANRGVARKPNNSANFAPATAVRVDPRPEPLPSQPLLQPSRSDSSNDDAKREELAAAALQRQTSGPSGISAQTAEKLAEQRAKDDLIGQIRELCFKLKEEPHFGTNASSLAGLQKYKQHLEQKWQASCRANGALQQLQH